MFFELSCSCEAVFQVEAENRDEELWLMAQRFINSHVECGFMHPVRQDTPEKTKRYNITLDKKDKKEKEE